MTEALNSGQLNCYPVALNLEGKKCLVVGGGQLATEKVEGLLRAGAQVSVVTVSATPRLTDLAAQGDITLHYRPYGGSDLRGVFLVIAAAHLALNAQVATEARAAGILVNAVDDPPNCDFYAMAIARRGDLQVAISTNGLSPAFARYMREEIDAWLPQEYAGLLAALGEVRTTLRARGYVPPYQSWRDAITPQILAKLAAGRYSEARDSLLEALSVAVPA